MLVVNQLIPEPTNKDTQNPIIPVPINKKIEFELPYIDKRTDDMDEPVGILKNTDIYIHNINLLKT